MLTLYCHAEFNPKEQFSVKNLTEASKKYQEWIASGPFSVDILTGDSGMVKHGDSFVAIISYNGKVWGYNFNQEIDLTKSFIERLAEDIVHNTDILCPVMAKIHPLPAADKRAMVEEHIDMKCEQFDETIPPVEREKLILNIVAKMEQIDRNNKNEPTFAEADKVVHPVEKQ